MDEIASFSQVAGGKGWRALSRPPCVRGLASEERQGERELAMFYNYFDTFPVAVVSEFRLKEPRDVV